MKTIDILNFSNFFIVFGNYLEISWAQLQIRQHCKSIAISNFSNLFFGFPTKIIVIFNFSNFFICFLMKTLDIHNFSNFFHGFWKLSRHQLALSPSLPLSLSLSPSLYIYIYTDMIFGVYVNYIYIYTYHICSKSDECGMEGGGGGRGTVLHLFEIWRMRYGEGRNWFLDNSPKPWKSWKSWEYQWFSYKNQWKSWKSLKWQCF